MKKNYIFFIFIKSKFSYTYLIKNHYIYTIYNLPIIFKIKKLWITTIQVFLRLIFQKVLITDILHKIMNQNQT